MSWKKEFLELFISSKKGDYGKALDLKRKNIPEKLYRFRSLTNLAYTIEEICEGKIYMAHPKEQNDPFDACSLLHSEALIDNLDKQEYMDKYRHIIDKDTFDKIFSSKNWFDELLKIGLQENSMTDIDKLKEAFAIIIMPEQERINNAITTLTRSYNRFACFTESLYNLPMWNHYANGHKGICLEYDTTKINDVYMANRIFPVFYKKELPDGLNIIKSRSIKPYTFWDYILIHKFEDWSYEKEWRLIYNAGSWFLNPEDIPEDFYDNGKSLDFILPSRIILGYSTTPENEKLLRKIGKNLNIPVVKMTCTEYGLKIENSTNDVQ